MVKDGFETVLDKWARLAIKQAKDRGHYEPHAKIEIFEDGSGRLSIIEMWSDREETVVWCRNFDADQSDGTEACETLQDIIKHNEMPLRGWRI